ncbi:MAG: hypothetical protein ACYSSI_10340 [Planctomycetota bacterium]|jgi:hypothetical protein
MKLPTFFKKQKPKYDCRTYISTHSSFEKVEILKQLDDEEILNLLAMHDNPHTQEPCKAELTLRHIKALNKFSRTSSFLAKIMIALMVMNLIYVCRGVIYTFLQRAVGIE